MPRTPKYYRNKDNLFITTSVEEGLMFPSNELVNMITLSCLAKAQQLYPVRIFAISQAATHIHKGMQVINPEDVARFMRYFKTESAHMINRLLGRKKRTVWCEGYDSPIMCTPYKCMEKSAYIFSNPVKDDLIHSVEAYPGINTFDIFKSRKVQHINVPLLSRTDIEKLPEDRELKAKDYVRIAKELSRGKPTISLCIEPLCWAESYNELSDSEIQMNHKRVCEEVNRTEQECQSEGRRVMGAERLRSTPVGREYHPERKGRRTNFLTECVRHRAELISGLKQLRQLAIEVYEEWKKGNIHIPYPSGLFPPAMPRQLNMLAVSY